MQNPQGHVIALGSDPGAVVVAVAADVVCQRCADGKGCGAGLLGGRKRQAQIVATLASGLDVAVGDEVAISLQPRHVLQAALLVYGLPLAGALLAAGLAYIAGLGDSTAAIAALAGLLAGLATARTRLRRSACLRNFTPTVVERLASS